MAKAKNSAMGQAPHPSTQVQRPTIFDLERYTGFSRSTISRAFNPEASVKKATRERIIEAADKIGFSRHPGARMIRMKRSFRWGLLLPHLENPEYAEMVEALDAEARRHGTNLILGLTHYDSKIESTFLRHWAAGEADGVICNVISWEENGSLCRQLKERRYPFYALYKGPEDVSLICKDDYDTFCLALRTMIGLGHRRIAFVGLAIPGVRSANAFRAYRDELKAHGIPWDESLIFEGPNNRDAGMQAWKQMKQMPDAPTAVMAFNDILASGVWIGAHVDGLSVPKHLSLMGNDNIPEARLMGLTSIRYDRASFARQVIDGLEAMRTNPDRPRDVISLSTELVMRASVGSPADRSKGWLKRAFAG